MIPSTAMTDAQRKLLFSQMERGGIGKEQVEEGLGFGISELSKNEASMLIDCFMNKNDLAETLKKVKELHSGESHQMREEKQEPMNMKKKQEFVVQPGSELALAKTAGIPEEMANLFFMKLNGNAYIKVAGLQYMAGKIGYQRIEISDKFDEKTQTWVAEARIYPKIPIATMEAVAKLNPDVQKIAFEELVKPTYGIGTANKENVQNSNMHKFLREMAQTRALGRALRSYTGYGSTTYEELPNAEIERD